MLYYAQEINVTALNLLTLYSRHMYCTLVGIALS